MVDRRGCRSTILTCSVFRFSLGNRCADTYRRTLLCIFDASTDASGHTGVYPLLHRSEPVIQRRTPLRQPCPHCDAPDMSLLRLVLIGEILRTDETRLVLLADIWQQSGLLAPPEGPQTVPISTPGRLHVLRP